MFQTFPPGPNTCPHCGTTACLSLPRKLVLGPAGQARCRVCGCRVGVDVGRAMVALLPVLAMVVIAILAVVLDPVPLVVPFVLCPVLWAALHLRWVPLRADELALPSTVEAGRVRTAAQAAAPRSSTLPPHA